ncbi:MAG: sigma 54-interacting transcriptional regulator, partial [Pyrinomonadaceae bacterium]
MTIALFATEAVPLQSVVSELAGEGLDVRAFDWEIWRGLETIGPEVSKGVLIVPRHGSGEPTAWARRLLGEGRGLILCAPQPDGAGRELLKELGANEIVTPRTWEPEHVAERILSQFILDGDVGPSVRGKLRGASRAMRELYRDLTVVATLPDPVLILGETGTGKELVAGEVHNLSKRPDKFVPVNCGELSLELAGSDLFGHKKGSFTGATEARRGLLAEAGRGTLFLDEIGELDLKAQAILLRVLEEKKVRRLGSNETEDVPARIILATNRDLDQECEEGRFRQDLFERIRGFTLELRPLRERRADIPLLVHHFLEEFSREVTRELTVPEGALECLFDYEWPGNVRELRAAVRLAAAYADPDGSISAWRLLQTTRRSRKRKQIGGRPGPEDVKHFVAFDPEKDNWRDFMERAQVIYFQALLEATGGDKKEARRRSGL